MSSLNHHRRQGVRGLYTYPWDLDPQRLDSEVDAILGLGLNTVTLAASYHAGKFISVKSRRIIFPQDGSIYFPAQGFGRLKPLVSDLTRKGPDLFQALCDRLDVAVNAWTVLLHNTRLGQLHPECTARNLFGDSYPYSLCPAHPDVREYALKLCNELTQRYPLQALCLESPGWLPYAHGYHHEFAQIDPNPWVEAILGLCFCDACRTGATEAGVDMEGLRQRLERKLVNFLESSIELASDMATAWTTALCREDRDLAALLDWRCGVVTQLVQDIKNQTPETTAVTVIPTIQRPHATAFWEGSHLGDLARVSDGLEAPTYQNCPQRILADAWNIMEATGPDKLSCILRPGPPDLSSAGQVQEAVTGLRRMGVRNLSFYNYGLLRPHNLTWMKNALKIDRETL